MCLNKQLLFNFGQFTNLKQYFLLIILFQFHRDLPNVRLATAPVIIAVIVLVKGTDLLSQISIVIIFMTPIRLLEIAPLHRDFD